MKQAIEETNRRRAIQLAYNEKHGITPQTVVRAIMNLNPAAGTIDYLDVPKVRADKGKSGKKGDDTAQDPTELLRALRAEMFAAAESLDFEKAARLRDELKKLEAELGSEITEASREGAYEPYGKKPAARKKSGLQEPQKPKKRSPAATKRATAKWKP
jgi:excinuclease ABC subunit B